MDIFNNTTKVVKDDLTKKIKTGSKVAIAAASFSLYAYQALKDELEKCDSFRFIFMSPTFVAEKTPKERKEFYISRLHREKSLYGTEFEVRLRNELKQKAVAKECAQWMQRKAAFRTNVTREGMNNFLVVDNPEDCYTYLPMNSFTTVELGCERGKNISNMVTRFESPSSREFLQLFDSIWDNKEKLQDVTQDVINMINTVYQENSPVGGHGGQLEVEAPRDAIPTDAPTDHSRCDDFSGTTLDMEWNTLRVPFTDEMGQCGGGSLRLIGRRSLASTMDTSMVASRWQAFFFDAETKVKFEPWNYQQMAGLTNFYNDKHWSWIFITFDEVRQKRVIEIAENNRGQYTSYLKDQAIVIPDDVEYVWFKTLVRKSFYQYAYSFNGVDWSIIDVKLDAAVLSDDYVLQTYGGFFTGAFVGLAAVDYSGYDLVATFQHFCYKELGED